MAKEEEPSIEKKEEAEIGKEKTEEEYEDAKAIASTMLIEGVEVEKIAEETGLTKRQVWALKGALARAGKIPTKKELEIKEMAGVKEGGEVPFRREKSAPELIVEISKKYGVKDRATRIIADRCQRVPGGALHPSDFQRLLMDLDTGLQKREAILIAEEYDLALQHERTEEEEYRGRYYAGRSASREGGGYYRSEEERYPARYGYESQYEPRYDRYGRPIPAEGGRGEVTMRDLERIEERISEKIARSKEEDRFDKVLDTIRTQGEDMATLATELKNLKDNPPTAQPSMEDNPYLKALELQLNVAREDSKATREEMKEQAKEFRELIRDERKEFREELGKREKDLEEAKKSAGRGEGYRDDSIRLASEGMHRVADVLEKKEPIKVIVQGTKALVSEKGEEAPEREKVGESKVSAQIPSEYLE